MKTNLDTFPSEYLGRTHAYFRVAEVEKWLRDFETELRSLYQEYSTMPSPKLNMSKAELIREILGEEP